MKKILCMAIRFIFVTQTTFASPIGDRDVLFQDNIITKQVIAPPTLQTFLFLNPLSEPFVKIIRTFLV